MAWTQERELQILEAKEKVLREQQQKLHSLMDGFLEESRKLLTEVSKERIKLHNRRAAEINWLQKFDADAICPNCNCHLKRE